MRRSNLAAERARKGLNKTQMAELLGVNRHTYNGWENKGTRISSDHLLSIAQILGVSDINYLLETTDD